MTTEDLTAEPLPTPLARAENALFTIISNRPDALASDLDPRELARAALAETAEAYISPDRPIEIELTLADEQGPSAQSSIELPRDLATPEVLGYALGNVVVGALASYYCGSDAAELGDAVHAVRTVLS